MGTIFSFLFVRSLYSTATMYRRLAEDTELTRYTLCRAIQDGANYAKFYRASSLLYNKAIQKNCLWTAHGVKVWPGDVDLRYIRSEEGKVVSAMPLLEDLLHINWHVAIEEKLQQLIGDPWFLANSLCNERKVFRIPLAHSLITRRRITSPLLFRWPWIFPSR